jgi:sugar lactone lactonase YvrE
MTTVPTNPELAVDEMPPAEYSCAPSNGLNYVGGPTASEDLAHIPGTRWLIASGMNIGSPAHLYLVDMRTQRAAILFPIGRPAMAREPHCGSAGAEPPNLATLSTDGINLRVGDDGRHMLYAANHGDRFAIEMFRIDARGPVPAASWAGCVPMPAGTRPNAVVPLRDGGFLAGSFYDPRDKEAWAKMDRGEDTGSLWEWQAASGFRRIDVGGISGANGLEISADEHTIYAGAWSGRAIMVLDRRTGTRRVISLDFLPDNIKRAADGTLFVAGQRSTVAKIAACGGAECPQDWIVARIDSMHNTVTPLLTRPGNALINYACAALEVEGTLYITARGDRRLAYVPMASLPSLY